MRRRTVRCSPEAVERAQEHFPSGGDSLGRPSWALFERTLLRAATAQFARDFEGAQAETPDYPVRFVVTAPTPLFPEPVAFFAVLTSPDAVEIIDIVVDRNYPVALADPDD